MSGKSQGILKLKISGSPGQAEARHRFTFLVPFVILLILRFLNYLCSVTMCR